ncbi:MAG: DUF1127 domain-containing protein [Mesorhizobium sp.]|uniref:DUF1127 domain-containing protein n=1 Tax=Mesorhizobium sp. TaxID=1871066 RepID=UPI000FE2F73E|nr:DUF1127 domain-containing protein [Mesorhizobium sp.]RWK09829.1 MAG: DUF1127 domain-containing protein [Mesorhizobium sp.]RWK23590.1 MAG: DUF1127 domain-containing protein [Mesorhizobium sp.]RWK31198.1 MAG: DUF1127 domain-containing protein [Mesorhizobium sp.]TIQ50195.1 MAG: DUF1127 domain-containing protein [Mesorhizobium sp.]TIQ56431.1 MAG: DUF1127 domain-containing protein [Mesorhizobium sp.]
MQSLQTSLQFVPRLVAAALRVARSALANAAARYRDRRILERLNATELEDIGLCRSADGTIDFRPHCPDEAEPNVADIAAVAPWRLGRSGPNSRRTNLASVVADNDTAPKPPVVSRLS